MGRFSAFLKTLGTRSRAPRVWRLHTGRGVGLSPAFDRIRPWGWGRLRSPRVMAARKYDRSEGLGALCDGYAGAVEKAAESLPAAQEDYDKKIETSLNRCADARTSPPPASGAEVARGKRGRPLPKALLGAVRLRMHVAARAAGWTRPSP